MDDSKTHSVFEKYVNEKPYKVEPNVLDVSYHVTQYRTVISELRDEIERLRTKITDERPRQGSVNVTSRRQSHQIKRLREDIVNTFKEQMRLRRKLMDLDGTLLSLSSEAERQHMLISQWESRNNKLYKNHRNNSKSSSKWHINSHHNSHTEESDKESSDADASDELQRAWVELATIEREQERQAEVKESTERELEDCRQRGLALEEELPTQISTEEESELLALMLRCHELEVEKMALQSERLIKQHELRRRDIIILRFDRQRQLCETIITRQRELMEEGCIKLPADLQELYRLYQQEIHAATYTDINTANYQVEWSRFNSHGFLMISPFVEPSGKLGIFNLSVAESATATAKSKLPPISQSVEPLFHRSMRVTADESMGGFLDNEIRLRTPTSSAEYSDYSSSPLPPISSIEAERMGHGQHLPPPAVLFPPISDPRGTSQGMRRIASDDNISLTPERTTRSRSRFRWAR